MLEPWALLVVGVVGAVGDPSVSAVGVEAVRFAAVGVAAESLQLSGWNIGCRCL